MAYEAHAGRRWWRTILRLRSDWFPTAALASTVILASGCGGQRRSQTTAAAPIRGGVRLWTIHYRAHNGARRAAYIVAPRWYGPRRDPPLPLVISPHGCGVDGRTNAQLWDGLPARGHFLVVSPDGEGERLPLYSWGASGQVDDLRKMPRYAQTALPWLRVARGRVYAVGGSMGGQEVLLLVARAGRLLAGAVAFDAPSDFAEQYARFPRLPCSNACLRRWKDPIGLGLQELAREEVGGTPHDVLAAYAARSPITYAGAIANSGVPLQLWWSTRDVVVPSAEVRQFVTALKRAGAASRVTVVRGSWTHVSGMRLNLPHALSRLGLLRTHAPRSGR